MNNLKISKNVSLPIDVVTQTIGVLAKRRSGKSYFMRRFVEQLLKAGQQVVQIDPKGDQWGLRSSADGKAPGFPVVILGGEHGDVRLEVGAGEVVAKLVVEERVSALLDLSLFRKQELATFMASFLETLYRLKAREQFRTPMMLAIDEADSIAPQRPMHGEERMLGAAEDIVRRGGQRGIGCTMVTQRSAVLNKNVLTQIQVLVALRMIAPQDLAAMDAWIDVHGTQEERKKLMASLPSLPVGDAWIWSPGWPTNEGIFERIHTLPIETFDSGATPKPGEKRIDPKNLADINLDLLKRQMASTIEKAKADDPRELRRQISALQAELKKTNKTGSVSPEELQAAEKKGWERGVDDGHKKSVEQFQGKITEEINAILGSIESIREVLRISKHQPLMQIPYNPTPKHRPEIVQRERTTNIPQQSIALPSGERKILIALAQYPTGRTKSQIAILAGYASNGGGFNNYLASLRSKGFAHGTGTLKITDAGLSVLGNYDPLPTGQDLLNHWLRQLGLAERKILEYLASVYPESKTKFEIGPEVGYEPNGGGFNNALSRLRTLELITGRGELRASEDFYQ